MKKILIVHEDILKNKNKFLVDSVARIIGPYYLCSYSNLKNNINYFDFILLFSSSAKWLSSYLKENIDMIKNKFVFIIVAKRKDNFPYIGEINSLLGGFLLSITDIPLLNEDTLKDIIVRESLKIKSLKDNFSLKAPSPVILESCIDFLNSHNTCTLCTTYLNSIRITTLEYLFIENSMYFLSEGGKKFCGILYKNPIALSIHEDFSGFNNLKSLNIYGTCKIVKNDSIINNIFKLKGLDTSKLNDLKVQMSLVKIEMDKIEFLNSDFEKLGYDSKQILLTPF